MTMYEEGDEEFEVTFELPSFAPFYVTDDDYRKISRVSKFISEILTAVQVAKRVGIEDFSIIRIINSENFPVHSFLTKRALENFDELMEVVEELADEDEYYTVELLDLNRYDCETVIMLLDEVDEYDMIEAVALDCKNEDEEGDEE